MAYWVFVHPSKSSKKTDHKERRPANIVRVWLTTTDITQDTRMPLCEKLTFQNLAPPSFFEKFTLTLNSFIARAFSNCNIRHWTGKRRAFVIRPPVTWADMVSQCTFMSVRIFTATYIFVNNIRRPFFLRFRLAGLTRTMIDWAFKSPNAVTNRHSYREL